MSIISVFFIAVGLAMDAFAISVTNGIKLAKLHLKDVLFSCFMFGFFQFFMPIIGFYVGSLFSDYIMAYDNYVAFGILAFIGGKMIAETFKKDEDDKDTNFKLDVKVVVLMAIATSIDALAIGVTFAVTNTNVLMASVVIGVITFIVCLLGTLLGKKLGSMFKVGAERLGGLILILMGIYILNEQLGFF